LNGNAAIVSGAIRLTNQNNQFFTGSAWFNSLQKVLNGFSAVFAFKVTKANANNVQRVLLLLFNVKILVHKEVLVTVLAMLASRIPSLWNLI